jgi:leucyl-tRNA synthetase
MSKRYFNTIDPEKICDDFGADTLRCYEMFLGPITEHKPWNINGISGVYNYFKKTWKLIHGFTDKAASQEELKLLHKTIKKITEDIDNLSFNTAISTFMITTNELIKLKTTSKKVFKDLLVLLSPFAPHFTEELWETLGSTESITKAPWPKYNEKYLVETNYSYPVSFNGKMRFKIQLGLDLDKDTIEAKVLKDPRTEGYLDSKTPKKVIVVPGKIVNIVI